MKLFREGLNTGIVVGLVIGLMLGIGILMIFFPNAWHHKIF